jgi:hypothetical protein
MGQGGSTCLEYADEIGDLDMTILRKAKEVGLGWAGVSRHYVKAAKEKVMIEQEGWSTTWETTLAFLGAYRKLLIDHMVTGYIAKLQESEEARRAYRGFMGDDRFADVIQFTAMGSTHATSDYDLTLCGPAVPCIVRHMTTTFTRALDETTTYALDSNFYIGPDIMLRKGTKRYAFRMFFPDGESERYNVAVPVPTGAIVAAERGYILRKVKPRHVDGTAAITANYAELVRLGTELDKVAYRDTGKVDERNLFELLFKMKLFSMEAYHGISTVLVVVYGLQAGKMAEVRKTLSAECFENAMLENALDFANHWNEYAASFRTAETDQATMVKLSKYLVRILTCVGELQMRGASDPLARLDATRGTVEAIYKDRAAGVSSTKANLADFGIPETGAIDVTAPRAGLVCDVYRYCTRAK